MDYAALPDPLARLLARPELRPLARGVTITARDDQGFAFCVPEAGLVDIGAAWLRQPPPASGMRQALELALLLRVWPGRPVLAGLAAARCAALFARQERLCTGADRAALADGDAPPDAATAAAWWRVLRTHQPGAPAGLPPGTAEALAWIWPLLGPAEFLLTSGGDERLLVDGQTGLNQYGCSPRPRPAAITYASSTASSISERGYAGAEAQRQRLLAGATLGAEYAALAGALREEFLLPAATGIVFAASGTDSELIALATTIWHASGWPVTSILLAAEETGSGIPLAAAGRHFATFTAGGQAADKANVIAGFPRDTLVASLPARGTDGRLRGRQEVAADCAAQVAVAVSQGRRCLVHLPDLSKTGLLPVLPEDLAAIQARHPDAVDVVVDACQMRLAPDAIGAYLARGWMVQVTGSKFFTGPPFAGAVLLPPAMAARLDGGLPEGLRAYATQAEWVSAGMARPAGLPEGGNAGLLLRWAAALAEIRAFHAVPPAARHASLSVFLAEASAALRAVPGVALLDVPPPPRADDGAPRWDALGTILTFTFTPPGEAAPLDMARARQVHRWLNRDLLPFLPGLDPALADVARRCCHVGQPVAVGAAGALRVSAGARLVSGEPSHAGLHGGARLAREVADMRLLARKLALVLAEIDRLAAAPG